MFVIFYAGVFVFLCSLLFPDDLQGYDGLEDYFMSRRKWFFGLLAATFLLDLVDTSLKGTECFRSLGLQYLFRNFAYVTTSATAMFVENRRFHAVFVACALVYLVVWMVQRYFILS